MGLLQRLPELSSLGLRMSAFGISTLGVEQPHGIRQGLSSSYQSPEYRPCTLRRTAPPCWLLREAGPELWWPWDLERGLAGGPIAAPTVSRNPS